MDTESCKVLVQTDDAGRVTAINSDAFVSGDGWTQIDEGEGDRYRHAQNNYLIEPLSAVAEIERENILVQTMEGRRQKAREGKWNGGFAPYGYKLVDGLVAQRTQAEMDADFDALPAPPLTTEERVNNVEQRTDALESANDDLILMMADLIGG